MLDKNTFVKPFSQACELNKGPILIALKEVFSDCRNVLEIASGTGQHAVYFGEHLPQVVWQTSDLQKNHDGIQAWLDEAQLANVKKPIILDVNDIQWPINPVDAVFNANTVHIISWPEVQRLFTHIARITRTHAVVCFYGPYNYNGNFTSDSNARFDASLKARDAHSGIRDFEAINTLASSHGLTLQKDLEMPSNNRLLVWVRNE
jgi:cyclopropane fatty-acyl-phospholipid synthase-like methyltransferase